LKLFRNFELETTYYTSLWYGILQILQEIIDYVKNVISIKNNLICLPVLQDSCNIEPTTEVKVESIRAPSVKEIAGL
jgi:hypothetical protein